MRRVKMTRKFWWLTGIFAGITFVCFLIISIVVFTNGLAPLGVDTAIANWAYSARGEKGGVTYWFFRVVTELGYTYFIVALVVLMFVLWRARLKAWFFGGTILATWILQKIVKAIIMRPRPDETMWWMSEGSSSFPSGHSMMVAVVFVLLAYFVITSPAVKTWIKCTVSAFSSFAILIVPISRIILGVHYFSDVLGGLMLGTFMAIIGIMVYKVVEKYMSSHSKRTAKINQNVENIMNTQDNNKQELKFLQPTTSEINSEVTMDIAKDKKDKSYDNENK